MEIINEYTSFERRFSNNEHDSNRDFAHPFHCSYDYRV